MATDIYADKTATIDTGKIMDNPKTLKGPDDVRIGQFDAWHAESKELRRRYDERWAKNTKLVRGIFPDSELARSKVRRRSKIFFRKIWASNWRLLAAMHDAFLKEVDQFQVVARDGKPENEAKAEAIQYAVEYRRDVMMRTESLFLQLIWSIMTILDLGWACAKFGWRFEKKDGKVVTDKPDFNLYPNEQVFPDLSVSLPHKMRYIIFESYLTEMDMKDSGWDCADCDATSLPENQLRNARFQDRAPDPLSQAASDNQQNQNYPKPGSQTGERTNVVGARYTVREIFWREDGKIMMAVYSGRKMLVKPQESPYGNRYPVLMGQCLTLAHQMIGEGFPEPQEGPQESYNVTLNQRKDNVSVVMNGESLVDRYANVDLDSLKVSRPANVILTDNVEAVKPMLKPDVTQSAYAEAQMDANMMDETSGVTPGLLGLDKSSKATTSQINFSNAGAKVGLFMSIVAQTWFRDFWTQFAYMVQRLETDETVFEVANRQLKKKRKQQGKDLPGKEIDTWDDFIADVDVRVQPDLTTKQQDTQNLMMLMDRGIMSNNAMASLAKLGVIPPAGLELINTAEIYRSILPKVGQKDLDKFFLKIPKEQIPPPAPPGGGGGGGAAGGAMTGATTAQAEQPDTLIQHVQEGNAGATGKLG